MKAILKTLTVVALLLAVGVAFAGGEKGGKKEAKESGGKKEKAALIEDASQLADYEGKKVTFSAVKSEIPMNHMVYMDPEKKLVQNYLDLGESQVVVYTPKPIKFKGEKPVKVTGTVVVLTGSMGGEDITEYQVVADSVK